MSQTSSTARLVRAVAVTGLASSAALFATSTPASANTNFNGTCESSESCIWQGDIWETAGWDYEGTDTDLRNNYYPRTGAVVNDNSRGLTTMGTSCTAVWGNNPGTIANSTKVVRITPGSPGRSLIGTTYDRVMSTHTWAC
ncbi:hypothetical protein GCM10010112_44980 [Actinoplanes lobatus]|uniref:Peptidase inhibitor family I36 n=1 Tax=Actinoplanes lobatus TaxID=113568 RepID=A0A7W7HG85_9ACTN|nr:hypothetical protein [Actinoplanes lobatus]MBB4749983.1 hypothetical protein [Actinoplanes lobatus]GGN74634.1 hypothetical protein GCM10010112_44980 [Actinoplanes lobatus]GIE39128.1 hypothetical protein Alo02nite_20260 [Actinoplanes lobatus]